MLCEHLVRNCWAKMLRHFGQHSRNSWHMADDSTLAGENRQKGIRVSWPRRCHLGPLCTSSVTPQPLCCPRRECIFKISWQLPGREPRGEKWNRERGIQGLDTQRKIQRAPLSRKHRVPISRKENIETWEKGRRQEVEGSKAGQRGIPNPAEILSSFC